VGDPQASCTRFGEQFLRVRFQKGKPAEGQNHKNRGSISSSPEDLEPARKSVERYGQLKDTKKNKAANFYQLSFTLYGLAI
jgi:hypothetical protein